MMMTARAWRRFGASMFAVTIVSAILTVPAGRAHAQTDSQKQSAKEHFEKASRLYDVGRYQDAIEEYQKAYLNVEDPVFLFNIAQCYRLSDRPVEAVRFYRNYLRRAPAAPNRADVERRIAEMDKLVQEREKAGATTTEPPAAGTTPPVAGTVTAPPAGTAPPPAATGTPAVTPPPPPPSAGPDLSAQAAPPRKSSGRRPLAYGLMIGGGAGIVVGAVAGAIAASKAHDVETKMVFNPSDEKAGKTFNALAIGFGVAGAAAAIVGGVLLLTDHPSYEVATAPPARPRSRAQLAPIVGPGLAGAQAGFVF